MEICGLMLFVGALFAVLGAVWAIGRVIFRLRRGYWPSPHHQPRSWYDQEPPSGAKADVALFDD